MADAFKHCSVPECKCDASGSAGGRSGLCNSHYKKKLKYGDPCHIPARLSKVRSWVASILAFDGEDCLIWPFARAPQGYGALRHGGKTVSAHRLICELVNGMPPTLNSDAAHSCGNGHEGCVNPRHLRWDTRAGNFADKLLHGTDARGEKSALAKIKNEDVVRIRSLRGARSQSSIAAEYGLTQPTISKIQSGKNWAWMP